MREIEAGRISEHDGMRSPDVELVLYHREAFSGLYEVGRWHQRRPDALASSHTGQYPVACQQARNASGI